MFVENHIHQTYQKLEHFDDISFRERFFVESALFLSQNKNGTYLNQGICIYAGHSFYEIQFNYFFLSLI